MTYLWTKLKPLLGRIHKLYSCHVKIKRYFDKFLDCPHITQNFVCKKASCLGKVLINAFELSLLLYFRENPRKISIGIRRNMLLKLMRWMSILREFTESQILLIYELTFIISVNRLLLPLCSRVVYDLNGF